MPDTHNNRLLYVNDSVDLMVGFTGLLIMNSLVLKS